MVADFCLALPPLPELPKMVVLDEAESLTNDATNVISDFMEKYPIERLVIILICNEPQKLHGSLLSKCVHLEFCKIPNPHALFKLEHICQLKDVKFEKSALELILQTSQVRQSCLNTV